MFHDRFEYGTRSFFGIDVIFGLYIAYLVGLVPYYLSLPPNQVTKSRRVWKLLLDRRQPHGQDTTALLSLIVKGYYIPLMAVWTMSHIWGMAAIYQQADSFWEMPSAIGILHFIFFLDVAMFLFGYCIEHPRLGNEIRSVEPTVLGWFVALICYPPLRQFAIGVFEENPFIFAI